MSFKKAYGKINWILKVFPLEPQASKHKIDSVMQLWKKKYDLIKIKPNTNFEVRYFDQNKKELRIEGCSITKTVEWFKNNFPTLDTNYHICIKKRIPIGSGFGGESSDAAFVLKFLTKKHKLQLTPSHLRDIALNVGSDIPFFYSGYSIAHVNEYGDRVVKIQKINMLVSVYPISTTVSTKKIYQELDKDSKYCSNICDVKETYQILKSGSINFNNTLNDLQPYVLKTYPEVQAEFEKLSNSKFVKILVNGAGSYLLILKQN